jgi:hypothetical protein
MGLGTTPSVDGSQKVTRQFMRTGVVGLGTRRGSQDIQGGVQLHITKRRSEGRVGTGGEYRRIRDANPRLLGAE